MRATSSGLFRTAGTTSRRSDSTTSLPGVSCRDRCAASVPVRRSNESGVAIAAVNANIDCTSSTYRRCAACTSGVTCPSDSSRSRERIVNRARRVLLTAVNCAHNMRASAGAAERTRLNRQPTGRTSRPPIASVTYRVGNPHVRSISVSSDRLITGRPSNTSMNGRDAGSAASARRYHENNPGAHAEISVAMNRLGNGGRISR